jgi:ABC-type glycerol-3-phosphate transport system permease component
MLPLARPGLAAAALFTFVSSWNEFLIAVTMTSSPGRVSTRSAIAPALG